MNRIPSEKLEEYNKQGLIPGPGESEEDFIQRAEYCLHLKTELESELDGEVPFVEESDIGEEVLQGSFETAKRLYDITPEWVPVFFSNYQLSPWQGGCAWIFQVSEHSPTSALLQMRKAFATKSTYLGLYDRDELIAHELSHVGRMAFQEPKFEEIFAYQSSHSRYRRVLGPLFQSSWESSLLLILISMIVLFDLYFLAMGHLEMYFQTMWLKALPVIYVGYLLFRLFFRYRTFSQCQKKVKAILPSNISSLHVLYRLTDQEMANFSQWSSTEIQDYMAEQQGKSLRWRVICEGYFG